MKRENQKTSQVHCISVIVVCRNEERFIRRCLESLLGWEISDYELEVLVVDGRSTDRTRDIVAEYVARYGHIRLLDNPQQVKPTALNIGIEAARGNWIVRIDSHSEYPQDYLEKCIETALRTGADNVGGLFIAQLRENTLQALLVQALTTHRFGVGNSEFRLNASEGPSDTVPYGCYRREVFKKIGLFDERLIHCQDFEFNQRILHKGGTVWLNPAIQVLYYNQATLGAFFSKVIMRDGPWNPYMWYVAPYSFKLRHVVPMAFVLALTLGAFASTVFRWGLALPIAVLVPYILLALYSAGQQAIKYRKCWMLLLLPLLFFVYHIAHGMGGLIGVLRLALRNAPVQRNLKPSSP